tara:strand:- start:9601 stop:10128 length:528 start_codon:yes stop_codon:yes gene_type:complete
MVNPFSGIIDSSFKSVFNNAISALLENDALTIACTLEYGITKYENCSNCLYDPIGQKSANRFQDGGPAPFPFGSICPLCNGDGKKPVTSSENVNLAVIFEPRQFLEMHTPVNTADGYIQTLATKSMTPKLQRAKEIVVATDVSGFFTHRYQRVSEPLPIGLGNNEFVLCTWRRSG